jgi:hypothetical protein
MAHFTGKFMNPNHRTAAWPRLLSSLFLPTLVLVLAGCSDNGGPDARQAPSITLVDINSPIDVTPDGSLVLLEDLGTFEGKVYTYNTTTGILTHVTDVGDPSLDIVFGISANGRITGIHGNPAQAGVWSQAADWTDLPPVYETGCDPQVSGGFDISGDGHVIVGNQWNGCTTTASRWSDASGTGEYTPMEVLGTGFEGDTTPPVNRASVVSDNGQVAAGFAQDGNVDRRPAIWRADGSGFLLNPVVPDAPGEVLSINEDGSMVAGIWNQDAFYWTQATNTVILGHLPGMPDGTPTFPNAIAAGGKLIFGANGDGFSPDQSAMVWTAAKGIRSLDKLVRDSYIGIPPGSVLTNVLAASADGTVVVGTVVDSHYHQQTFILKASVSLYGL